MHWRSQEILWNIQVGASILEGDSQREGISTKDWSW